MQAVQSHFQENSSLGLSDDTADLFGGREADSDLARLPPLYTPTIVATRNDYPVCSKTVIGGSASVSISSA
eukprot:11054035-Ditylum_brightwellii.AAC.2